jgi:hypothetical protein
VYQGERFLSSKQLAKLGAVLEFVLHVDDEHVGQLCEDCKKACKEGDRVFASDSLLHHAEHFNS